MSEPYPSDVPPSESAVLVTVTAADRPRRRHVYEEAPDGGVIYREQEFVDDGGGRWRTVGTDTYDDVDIKL